MFAVSGKKRKKLKRDLGLKKSAYNSLDYTIDIDRVMGMEVSDEEKEQIRERLIRNIEDLERQLQEEV